MEFPLLLLVVFVIVVVGLLVTSQQNAGLREAYRTVAQRYGGSCDEGGWFTRPSFRFHHGGTSVLIDIYSTGGKHPTYYTQAHFLWPDRQFRCEIYPEDTWQRVKRFFGMEDTEIGSPQFDAAYVLHATDRPGLKSLLNASVQVQIDRLRDFLGNDNIYVSINQGKLLVKKLSKISTVHGLQEFVQLAVELYDQARLTLEGGIEIIAPVAPPKATEVTCQICGEAITSQKVFCRRCKTPHHQDCWEYYGACSIYGCSETRYYVPGTSRPGTRPP
jgi:hypothetical protein